MSRIIEITDINASELDVYAKLNEKELLHYYEPHGGLFIAETPMVVERAIRLGYEPVSFLAEKKEIDKSLKEVLAMAPEIPIYTGDLEVLTKLTGFHLTRGLLCAMKRKALPTVEEVVKDARRIVILEDVVNPANVGAIFRSAAALNMDAILLTPASSDPLYRRSVRVSMATVFQIPWTFIGGKVQGKTAEGWPKAGMKELHELGFKTVAMALKEDSFRIDDPALMAEEKLAIVLGTEGDGMRKETIASCDYTVMIPMAHGVDSLNVAAASAVAFYQLGKR